jgi:hypothetical protein
VELLGVLRTDADGGEGKSLPLVDVLPLLQDTSVHWVIFQRGYGLKRFQLANLNSLSPQSRAGSFVGQF